MPDTAERSAPREGKAKRKRKRTEQDNPLISSIKDRKVKARLERSEGLHKQSKKDVEKIGQWLPREEAGYLEAEGLERTFKVEQADLAALVEEGAAHKAFDLSLTQLGPYHVDFTRSGRHIALAGHKGHLAVMDFRRLSALFEIQLGEEVRAVQFLHNEMFVAAAQRKYVYIYDHRGVEVHCLREARGAAVLQYLPHHFLLCSVGDTGALQYQDTSTGQIVATHRTRLGACSVMRQNPHNAVLCLGHGGGTVTMWSPNLTSPLVKMQCHRGSVRALALDEQGRHMATTGVDGLVRVWDLRTYRALHTYSLPSPACCLEVSQRGLLAVGRGRTIEVWREALSDQPREPYMRHVLGGVGGLVSLRFCPWEDVLAAGHAGGLSSLLVPGAGEPRFDSRVANPFASVRERREQEVALLLDKLQPDSIVLDPDTVGQVRRAPAEVQQERREAEKAANHERLLALRAKRAERAKMKGRNRPSRRHRTKQVNVVEDKRADAAASAQQQQQAAAAQRREKEAEKLAALPRALHRLARR